jgi:predicted transcriptional regulator
MGTMTTIQVDRDVRERLATLAKAHGRTLSGELGAILDDVAWQSIEAGYRRLAAQPAALSEYQDEIEAWSSLDLDSLENTAAAEYPEYNPRSINAM